MPLESPSRSFGARPQSARSFLTALIQNQLPRWPTAESRKTTVLPGLKNKTLNLMPSEAFAFVKTAFALPTI